jgi:NAD(P)-dependent dehydrogenase (short-subunit alcohol dehydrogenase family)
LASRSLSKVQACIDELKKSYPNTAYHKLSLDLASQQATSTAAAEILSWTHIPAIDIVVNSAGVMHIPTRTLSVDGIEMHLAVNYLGHFLFTCLIMPKLITASEKNPVKGVTRIINVTSMSPTWAGIRWSDMNFEKKNKTLPAEEQPPYWFLKDWETGDLEEKSYIPFEAYNQSKVGNVLFSIALNARLYHRYGILSLAIHPGFIVTELPRYADEAYLKVIDQFLKSGAYIKTLGAGAATTVVAAVDGGLGLPTERMDENGKENVGVYLIDCQVSDAADPRAVSSANAERLWSASQNLVGKTFAW